MPDGTPLALRLNSPGGSVFDAVAIYNAIKRHSGTVTVWIDGIAASAASYIAMAGDKVVMPENAFLMIHDPAGVVMGTAIDMRAMAEALDKIKGSLLQGYAAKSGRPQEEIAPLMAAETWLDAKDALDLGFADRIAEPVRIAARFDVASSRPLLRGFEARRIQALHFRPLTSLRNRRPVASGTPWLPVEAAGPSLSRTGRSRECYGGGIGITPFPLLC